jgi:GntR family transcriptional regulator
VLAIEIHTDSPLPVYRQIADALRHHLVAARLKPGDLLPPVRQLAVDLGVHFNTVAQAYGLLADENWLDLKRRRGALVLERALPRRRDETRVDARLRDLTAELRSAGVTPTQIAAAVRRAAKGSVGLGWTLNFGNVWAWVFLVLALAVPMLIVRLPH